MFNMNKNLHVSKLWKIDEGAESDIQERAARPSRFPITTLASLRLTESDSSLRSRYEQKGCWRNGRLVQRTIVAPKLSTSCDSNVRSGIEDQSTTSFASSLKYQGNTGDSSGSYDSQYLFQPVDRPTLKSESPTGLLKPEPVVFSKWKKVHQVVQASYQMNELSRHQPFTKNRVQETQRLENSDSQFMFPEAKNGEHSISCNLRKLPNELHRQSPLNMSNVTASFQKHCTIDNDDVSSTGSSSDHTLVGEESQATEDTLTEERLGVIHEDTFSPETVCTARPASTNPVSEEELYYTASQHQRGQLRNTEKDKSTDGISKSTNDVDESCSSYSWHGPSTHEKWGESAVSNSPDMSVCSSLDTEDSQSASSTTSGHAGSNNAPLLHQDHLPSYLDKIPTEPQSRVAHWARIGAYVRECYEKGKICDIRFHVEKETLLAHRAPLCTVSPYFASVFYENDYLNSKPMAEVRLNGITMQSLKVFMDFVYTGKLEIVLPVLLDLVKISDLFEIPEVKQRCVRELDFLPEEDLVMLLVAVREDTGLHFTEPLLHCISDKFLTVCNSQGFLELDVDTLCLILSDDRLLTRTELEVFRAALRWIHHNANLRSQFLETVMATVRFPLMTQSDLFECLDTFSLLGINRQCLDMIYKANWIRTAMALERDDPLHLTIPFPRSRCSHENTNNNVLNTSNDVGSPYKMDISVGSFRRSEEKRTTVIESRNQSKFKSAVSVPLAKEISESKQESTTTCNQSNQIENHTVVFLDRKLYIIGGMYEQEGESVPRRDVLVYSQEYGWQSLAPMKVARMHHSLCVVDGFIYALGGLGSNNRLLRSVERYDPHTDNWCFVRSMSTPRGGACAAELDGEILVAGGFGDSAEGSFPILDSVESFNPFTNRWRPRGRLRFGRCNATLSRVGDTLYLSGGLATDRISSRTVIVPDVDVYHAREGRWMLRSRLDEPQHSAASTVSGPLLYLIGGLSVQGKVSIQCLDTRTNEWLSEFPLHSKARWIRSVTSCETSYF